MLPAYGIPKAVAAALQALPAVALPVLRKIQGESNTTTKIILRFLLNRFSFIEIQNLGTEQIVILGLQFV